MNGTHESPKRPDAPTPQKNLDRAVQRAVEALRGQSEDQLRWLGAEPVGDAWRLPVLEQAFDVDFAAGRTTTCSGPEVGPHWQILALHYLATTSRPQTLPPEVTFADLPTARSYAGVYHGRVVARLCATAGRSAESLRRAAGAVDGRPVDGGDAAFDFPVFPRVTLRLVWHEPDEEFPASATLLMARNIESYFCSEDVVVLSERLVSRLSGRPF